MPSDNRRDINLAIIGEDLTKPATDAAAGNFDKLGRKVDAFGSQVRKTSTQSGRDVQDFSRLVATNLRDGETGWQTLQRSIADTRVEIDRLRQATAATGSHQSFVDLVGAEHDLKALVGIADQLAPGFAKAGTKVGESFGSSLLDAVGDIPVGPAVIAGLVAYLAGPAAIVIGAALAGAVTAGVGFGVLAAGAVIESGNKRIAADLGGLRSDVAAEMRDVAAPLVTPFDQALHKIDVLFAAERPQFAQIFKDAAPAIAAIEDDVARMVRAIVPKLAPIAKIFAEDFDSPEIKGDFVLLADEAGEFFRLVAENKDTIKDVFNVGLTAINGVVVAMNSLLIVAKAVDKIWHATGIQQAATDLGHLIHVTDQGKASQDGFAAAALAAAKAAEETRKRLADSVPDYKKLTDVVNVVIASEDTLAQTMTDKVLSSLISTDNATLRWYRSLTDLSQTLKDNKHAIDIHTKAGQDDRQAILDAVQANIDNYNSLIQVGDSAEDAAKAYDKNTAALEKQLKKAGLTSDQIQGLIGKYEGVPDTVNTNLAMKGLTDAIEDLDDLIRQLHGLPPRKTVTIDLSVKDKGNAARVLAGIRNGTLANAAGSAWTPTVAPLGTTTAPPRQPTAVNARIDNTIYLDGRPFRSYTDRAIARERRRQKVGRL